MAESCGSPSHAKLSAATVALPLPGIPVNLTAATVLSGTAAPAVKHLAGGLHLHHALARERHVGALAERWAAHARVSCNGRARCNRALHVAIQRRCNPALHVATRHRRNDRRSPRARSSAQKTSDVRAVQFAVVRTAADHRVRSAAQRCAAQRTEARAVEVLRQVSRVRPCHWSEC